MAEIIKFPGVDDAEAGLPNVDLSELSNDAVITVIHSDYGDTIIIDDDK